jgi:TRAP transporter TAXI family solute receptor
MMKAREIEFAFQSAPEVYRLINAIHPIKKKSRFIRTVAATGNTIFYAIMARNDSGVETIDDLRGKKVTGGMPGHAWGSGEKESVQAITLEAHGLTAKDMDTIKMSSFREGMLQIKEGRAQVWMAGFTPLYMQVDKAVGMHVVPYSKKAQDLVEKRVPGIFAGIIPKGRYGIKADTPALKFSSAFWCHEGLNDELVYAAVKALFDHSDDYAGKGPAIGQWNARNGVVNPIIPYHAGAIKYYKEKGLWTPELEKRQQQLLAEMGMK